MTNFGKFLFYQLIVIATFLSQSSRFYVASKSLPIDSILQTTTEIYDNEATTILMAQSFSKGKPASQATTLQDSQLAATLAPTTFEPSNKAESLQVNTKSPIVLESYRPSTQPNETRSLYDELKLTSHFPSFSSFETSSEFMKFENMKINSNSEESKSDESLEKKFQTDKMSFKNNVTLEERHFIDEATFDEESVKYSTVQINKTKVDENPETTALPPILTTAKKGKYLDLEPKGDENINSTLPNGAEVWALAGMHQVESRKAMNSANEVELLKGVLNNTAKNLLDWSEITKMSNDSVMQTMVGEDVKNESKLTSATIGSDDPATSENKDVGIFVTSQNLPTTKTIIEDNRIELENGNFDFLADNKSHVASSDSDVVIKNQHDEREESAIEIMDPFRKSDVKKMKESLGMEEGDVSETTESTESFSTESNESLDTSTVEFYETTTSIVDSFTVIGEEEDVTEDVFKRTITEQYPVTTEHPERVLTTAQISSATTILTGTMQTTPDLSTVLPVSAVNEARESIQRNKSTKSIRDPTTLPESTSESVKTTLDDNEGLSSTFLPKYTSSRPAIATTQRSEEMLVSSSSPTVEIVDDEKFHYSTLLPETTTYNLPAATGKSQNFEGTNSKGDSLNSASLDGETSGSSNLGIISATVSVIVLLVIAAVAYFVLKRRNQLKFSQRCRPVGLDAYSLDNVSVYNSVRRKANALRLSKRSYGNSAFENPSLQSNVLDHQSLQEFSKNKVSIQEEFKGIPQVSVRVDEMPENCEEKNRYANVVPLPETRVILKRLNDDDKTEYINANFVKGPKDTVNYYIATQAPLENTVADFWRMIWEQNSKVIICLTDLTENGVERCAEYIPASVVLDNAQIYGDFQVTLKSREVKDKYAVSQLHLKNLKTSTWREIMHLWYSWPENGCPSDEPSVMNLLLDARGYLRNNLPEHLDENSNTDANKNMNDNDKLSTLDKTKSLQKTQGPLTLHCSPGTGRTGTLIACDIIMRLLETPPRQIDIPQIVYSIRRGRANAIRTKDQYEFIYNIAKAYVNKINATPTES